MCWHISVLQKQPWWLLEHPPAPHSPAAGRSVQPTLPRRRSPRPCGWWRGAPGTCSGRRRSSKALPAGALRFSHETPGQVGTAVLWVLLSGCSLTPEERLPAGKVAHGTDRLPCSDGGSSLASVPWQIWAWRRSWWRCWPTAQWLCPEGSAAELVLSPEKPLWPLHLRAGSRGKSYRSWPGELNLLETPTLCCVSGNNRINLGYHCIPCAAVRAESQRVGCVLFVGTGFGRNCVKLTQSFGELCPSPLNVSFWWKEQFLSSEAANSGLVRDEWSSEHSSALFTVPAVADSVPIVDFGIRLTTLHILKVSQDTELKTPDSIHRKLFWLSSDQKLLNREWFTWGNGWSSVREI